MEDFKLVIETAFKCFQVHIPFFNCTMWSIEIAIGTGAIVCASIRDFFGSD